MKKTGFDHYEEYQYFDIKDYDTCCTCKYFCDNEMETRFECSKEVREEYCYEQKER